MIIVATDAPLTAREAVYNSLLQATTIQSRFGRAEAIPIEALQSLLQQYGVGKRP